MQFYCKSKCRAVKVKSYCRPITLCFDGQRGFRGFPSCLIYTIQNLKQVLLLYKKLYNECPGTNKVKNVKVKSSLKVKMSLQSKWRAYLSNNCKSIYGHWNYLMKKKNVKKKWKLFHIFIVFIYFNDTFIAIQNKNMKIQKYYE